MKTKALQIIAWGILLCVVLFLLLAAVATVHAQATNLLVTTNSLPPSIVVPSEPAQSIYQRHWPAFTVVLMWAVRESHIWWPFLIESGGIAGVARLLWRGKTTTTPVAPAETQTIKTP